MTHMRLTAMSRFGTHVDHYLEGLKAPGTYCAVDGKLGRE